jgi:hypothetical protein
MDAVGNLHDRIRSYPGAWDRLQETLSGLYCIRADHPNLILGVKTTIIPLNARELDRIAEYAKANGLFTIISPRIITSNRFCNSDKVEDLRFSPEDLREMVRFFESPQFPWIGHREALLGYLRTGTIRKPCSAGFNTLFVRHNGEVLALPGNAGCTGKHQGPALGRVVPKCRSDRVQENGWFVPRVQLLYRARPGASCLALRGLCLFLRLASRAGWKEFDRLSRHMGLDKYL